MGHGNRPVVLRGSANRIPSRAAVRSDLISGSCPFVFPPLFTSTPLSRNLHGFLAQQIANLCEVRPGRLPTTHTLLHKLC